MKDEETPDLYVIRNEPFVRVRAERTLKFVSRMTFDEYKALGGAERAILGIDPDETLERAATKLIRAWAHSEDGIYGYLAQWGFLEQEIARIHHVKVFVNNQTAHEGDIL